MILLRVLRSPGWLAALTALAFALLAVPVLARHGFDLSVFIRAGGHFVDPAQLVSPILVKPNSDGYDGQFYYRLALAPFRVGPSAFGIQIDNPAWREQRIFYSIVVWAVSLGRAAAVPAAMFLVNLGGLAAIAAFAVRLTARLRLSVLTPLAILLCPGFFITLTHDTTEILAVALLLAALDAYFAERLVAYAVLGVLASLTRETSILALGGVFCFEVLQAVRGGNPRSRRLVICFLTLMPFLAWRQALPMIVGQSPQDIGAFNMGWPLVGAFQMLRDTVTGVRSFSPSPGLDFAFRAFTVGSALWLLGFCAVIASRTPKLLGFPVAGALAAAWLPVMALMSLLSAAGPWIEPTAYLRVFTECYVIGCLIAGVRPGPRWLQGIIIVSAALVFAGAWVFAVGER